jgi:non-specific serine/threonine protein kinase/serine/threonine-protein kinase
MVPDLGDADDTPTRSLDAAPGRSGSGIGPGQRIGPYLLKSALGAGGMGEVWLAEQQTPVRRPVALKLMQRQLLSPLSEAYFEVERQALARMDHPAIAKVFDAGRTSEGHPWFVMEWINGVPLNAWCRGQGAPLDVRLRLLMALARGVQHAHERGVLHRDLKPANVLVVEVDGQPQVKLIDFGIALGIGAGITSGSLESRSYEGAGSGAYMSPEQRSGAAQAVDPRSDVYALGMILLSLLLPEARLSALGEGIEDAQRLRLRIDARLRAGRGHAEPLLDAVPVPLLHVLRMALAPQQSERYGSAEAFADDLSRWLRGRPLLAVPVSRRYRIGCFVRRNALAVGASAGIVLALLAGLGIALYGLQRAEREAQGSRAMAEFLSSVLTSVDPEHAANLDRSLLKRILDQAYERAERELAQRPEVLADVLGTIGNTYTSFGEIERGLEASRRALALSRAVQGDAHPSSLRLVRRVADGLAAQGSPAEAEQLTRAALQHAPAALAEQPREWSDLQLSLAWALRDLGRYDEALIEATAARERLQAIGPQEDPDPLTAGYVVSVVLSDLGRLDEAEQVLRPLLAARQARDGEDHPRTLRLSNSLGVLLLQQRRYADAEPVLRQTLQGLERSNGPDHLGTLGAVSNLAGALRQQGKLEESGAYYQRAYTSFVRTLGEGHPRSIMSRANLGNFELDSGDAEAALASHLHARALATEHMGAEHPFISETYLGAGKALAALGRIDEARAALEHALALRRAQHAPGHRLIVAVETELAALNASSSSAE